MQVVVISKNDSVESIIIGPVTDALRNQVNNLNDNAFNGDKWKINERYVDKTFWDLEQFLFPEGFTADYDYDY